MLGCFREGYRGQEFSASAANFLAAPVRLSTAQIYDRKWTIYCAWCKERQIDPIHVTVDKVVDFPFQLFANFGLEASTIRAYKAAILFALIL